LRWVETSGDIEFALWTFVWMDQFRVKDVLVRFCYKNGVSATLVRINKEVTSRLDEVFRRTLALP